MDFHLDYKIRLKQESEYKSLYPWALQELSDNGESVGNDQIPWIWSLYFTASDVSYISSLRIEEPDEAAADERTGGANESNVIAATLHPGRCVDGGQLDDEAIYLYGDRKSVV